MKRYALSLIAALVLGLSLASAATAAPASPIEIGGATISNVLLNGVPGTQLVVAPGAAVSLTADWVDNGPCPGCIDFISVGFQGAPTQAGCLENFGSPGASGTNTVDLGTVPTTPGTYNIVALYELSFFCGQAWTSQSSSAAVVIAQIIVEDPIPTLPTSKDECKNGGWATFGETFKNQGDCVSFVATGGQNEGAGA